MQLKTLYGLPEPFLVPVLPSADTESILPLPAEPEQFLKHMLEGESSSSCQPLFDPEIIISTFSNSQAIQSSTERDPAMLARRFGTRWTVENAIKDCVYHSHSRSH